MKYIRPLTFHMPFGFWSTECHACKMIGAAFKARRGSWAKNPQMQSNSWRFEPQNWLQLQICLLNNKQLLSAYHTCYLFPGSFKSCLQAKELRKASGSDKVSKPKAETCTTKLTTLEVFSQQHLLLSCCANTCRISRFFWPNVLSTMLLALDFLVSEMKQQTTPPSKKKAKGCQQKHSIST